MTVVLAKKANTVKGLGRHYNGFWLTPLYSIKNLRGENAEK
jgi:hypothetical protein